MKKVPNRLQCAYCIRNCTHGGECNGQNSPSDIQGCLVFKLDKRGCIRNRDVRIPVPLYGSIPRLDEWCDDYTLNEVDTELRIKRIYGFDWDTKSGYLMVRCNCDYFINEFSEDYIEPKSKAILKVIK
ncbi:hypothetical protein KM789_13270 [Clostridium tyrobutyricum]|nr:hypothetical protein [Clostridium tyrobutyricum]MBV4417177.1 hypothetical protein [Clostridium tyrobutyricum]